MHTSDDIQLPDDAGVHRDGLERILRRIPPEWGRWVDCRAGWYPLLVRLDTAISAIASDYEIHQVKQKFGGLRFYWALPRTNAGGATMPDAGDDPAARLTHLLGAVHGDETDPERAARITRLVNAAERVAAVTCERCGAPGGLVTCDGWLATLCTRCARD